MALKFVAASHQYLLASRTPVTTFPFTVGLRARPTFAGNGGSNQCAVAFGASGASGANFSIGCDGVPEWWLRRDLTAGTSLDELDVSTGVTANLDQFVLAQVSAANNVRLYALNDTGGIQSGQSTTSLSPSGINQMTLGSFADGNTVGNDTFDGLLGEVWVLDIDLGAGAAIDPALIRLLARDGPFGVGDRIANAVAWYIPGGVMPGGPDDYVRSGARPVWTNSGGATLVPDMPGSSLIVRPDEDTAFSPI